MKFVLNDIKTEHHELKPFSPFTIPLLIKFTAKLHGYSSTLLITSITTLYQVDILNN